LLDCGFGDSQIRRIKRTVIDRWLFKEIAW
jgi:hypothetical protein